MVNSRVNTFIVLALKKQEGLAREASMTASSVSGHLWVAPLCRLREQRAEFRLPTADLGCMARRLPSQPSSGLWLPKVGPERTIPLRKHRYQVLSDLCLLLISTEEPGQQGPCAHPSTGASRWQCLDGQLCGSGGR